MRNPAAPLLLGTSTVLGLPLASPVLCFLAEPGYIRLVGINALAGREPADIAGEVGDDRR